MKVRSQETPVKPSLFLVPGHDPSSDQSLEPLNVDLWSEGSHFAAYRRNHSLRLACDIFSCIKFKNAMNYN